MIFFTVFRFSPEQTTPNQQTLAFLKDSEVTENLESQDPHLLNISAQNSEELLNIAKVSHATADFTSFLYLASGCHI